MLPSWQTAKSASSSPSRACTASAFQHPDDVVATDALRSVPGLDTVVSKVMEYGFERLYYLDNVAGNVRVGPRQCSPRLYRALQWGCKILDVEEPELYVTLDPVPNAFTYGHTRPFIVMTSGLVDMLDDEERFFVIAHELGHIKADHVLYTVLAKNIAAIMTLIGQMTLGIGALLGQGLVHRAQRLVPQGRAHRRSRRPAVRAGHRAVHAHVHEDGRRRAIACSPRWTTTSSCDRSAPTKTPIART